MTDDGYSIPIEAPPALVPLSPPAAREAMVADEIAIAARNGVTLSAQDAERWVLRDLQVYEAVKREAPSTWTPREPGPIEAAERAAERQARKRELLSDVMASQPDLVDVRQSRVMHATSLPTDRWSLAKGRAARLLTGMVEHPNPVIAAAACDQPDLAVRLIVIMFDAARTNGRRHTGKWGKRPAYERHNPFWGVGPGDFGRVLQRLVEDVCDASTGRPGYGPWRVPK